jgi:hypothetical protein
MKKIALLFAILTLPSCALAQGQGSTSVTNGQKVQVGEFRRANLDNLTAG